MEADMPKLFRMGLIFDLLRIRQWIKNSFIFFPVLFAGQMFHPALLINVMIAFTGFCLLCSGVYIFNDYLDRERDRLHPQKALRPLASGEISEGTAVMFVVLLLGAGLGICSLAGRSVMLFAGLYIFMHLIYNFFVKRVVILDVIFIALGFQIRIGVGAAAVGVVPSVWLQLCVFLLALFLGFTKRRHELDFLKNHAVMHRDVLSEYNVYLLDQIIIICSTLAVVFYGLYTISPEVVARLHGTRMAYTLVFVIYGIFRYLYLAHVRNKGGDPGEILATDPSLLINVILWIFTTGILVYLH
jgi:4-hydroxybenzoate polyprenyltransferase